MLFPNWWFYEVSKLYVLDFLYLTHVTILCKTVSISSIIISNDTKVYASRILQDYNNYRSSRL